MMGWTSLTTLLGAFVAFLSRKLGVATSAIATAVLLTAALIACLNSLISNVLALMQLPEWIANAMGMFIPSNFSAILAAIISSHICRAAYDLALTKVKLVNSAS